MFLMVRSAAMPRVSNHAAREINNDQLVFIPSLAGLVVFAGSLNPIPSRTRPLNSPAPMVLSLKAWKSRSLPGLPRTDNLFDDELCIHKRAKRPPEMAAVLFVELPSADNEAAAATPRRFFCAPPAGSTSARDDGNHSLVSLC